MKQKIKYLASIFRTSIEKAKEAGEFDNDFLFSQFPRACCGDTSYLLAQYLLDNKINSMYVCGNRYFDDPEEGTQSHAWLIVDVWIVDITGDQFSKNSLYCNYDIPVYVGTGDIFHSLFEVEKRDIQDFKGLRCYEHIYQSRLSILYKKILKYCK